MVHFIVLKKLRYEPGACSFTAIKLLFLVKKILKAKECA